MGIAKERSTPPDPTRGARTGLDAENSQSDGIAANHSRMLHLKMRTAWVSKQPHQLVAAKAARVGDSMRLEGMNEPLQFSLRSQQRVGDCKGIGASMNFISRSPE